MKRRFISNHCLHFFCQLPLLSASKNNFLKDRLGVLVAKGAPVGASHVLVVLHPAVEVAVLDKVGGYFNSIAIRDLRSSVAHGLGDQVVSLLSSNNANAGAQESRSRAFAIVGNRAVVGSMEVVVFEVVSELRNSSH